MSTIRSLLSSLSSRRKTRNYDVTDLGILAGYLEEYLVPIGSIVTKLTTNTPGEAWILVEGQPLSKVDYPALYDEIGDRFGETETTFNLPDLAGAYLTGLQSGDAGAFVGANSINITVDQMPRHKHEVTDPGHSHTATSDPHDHGLTDPGHSHDVTDAGHAHDVTDPGHSHTAAEEAASSGMIGTDSGARSGSTSSETTGVSVDTATTGVSVDSATTGASVDEATVSVTIEDETTGISVDNAGGNSPLDNRPRSMVVYYFIKARV